MELTGAIRYICTGVSHTNRPMAELLRGCGEKETEELFSALADAVEAGSTPLAAWCELCDPPPGALSCLTERDQKAMTVFFSVLGASDRHAQIENARLTLDTLEALSAEANAVYAGKGRIYRAMGLLLGVGVGILLL